MSANKKIEKITHKHLDKIYTSSRNIAKSWKYSGIPISTLAYVIPRQKMGKDVDLPEEFKTKYNLMLDQLLKTCQSQARNKTVSFIDLKEDVRVMKEAFSKGLNV